MHAPQISLTRRFIRVNAFFIAISLIQWFIIALVAPVVSPAFFPDIVVRLPQSASCPRHMRMPILSLTREAGRFCLLDDHRCCHFLAVYFDCHLVVSRCRLVVQGVQAQPLCRAFSQGSEYVAFKVCF